MYNYFARYLLYTINPDYQLVFHGFVFYSVLKVVAGEEVSGVLACLKNT